jgi:hypothetical protein
MRPLPYREVKRKLEAAGFAEAAKAEVTSSLSKALVKALVQRLFRSIEKLLPERFALFFVKLE